MLLKVMSYLFSHPVWYTIRMFSPFWDKTALFLFFTFFDGDYYNSKTNTTIVYDTFML